ncbi:MAG: Ig-like domain-containing protein [Alphaproteobacteria bacterium]|nr:Ig-like domain-containing protein [Alphaproteobacteria bacterium]MCB9697386.1 Ig-like domain-containing protein [Alphaproteobacteria bacterium]
MFTPLVTILLACAPTPASLSVAGESPVVVHELGTLPLPTVQVLDANGNVLPTPEGLAFSVAPPTVATILGDRIETHADGDAIVTVTLGDLVVTAPILVSLPDTVEVTGVPDPLPSAGATFQLAARVLADGDVIADREVVFASSDPGVAVVDATGMVTLLAPGVVTLSATHASIRTDVALVVTAAEADPAVPTQL